MPEAVLKVEKLQKQFPITRGFVVERTVAHVRAVDGIDFTINSGETFSLVGESGCGKSTTGLLILRVLEPTAGSIWFHDRDIGRLGGRALREYRMAVQAMFQDPYASLNPRLRVRDIVAEPLVVNTTIGKSELTDRVGDALSQVGLGKKDLDLYPHEFSGGQRQRIALARALILRPKLVVLDEPVSALDVSIRAQILNDLKDLQQKLGVSYLLIAHGLDTVRHMSQSLAVMYLGKIVEIGPSEALFTNPMHPYTQALFSAALPSHPKQHRREIVLSGEVPNPINLPKGCRFQPRCFKRPRREICCEEEAELVQVNSGHFVRCHQCNDE